MVSGGAPHGQKTSDDDSGVEEVSAVRTGLEGKRRGHRIPRLIAQESCSPHGGVKMSRIAGDRMQVHERAGGITGDFIRDREIAALAGVVVTGDAPAGFLDSGTQKPAAGVFEAAVFGKRGQLQIVSCTDCSGLRHAGACIFTRPHRGRYPEVRGPSWTMMSNVTSSVRDSPVLSESTLPKTLDRPGLDQTPCSRVSTRRARRWLKTPPALAIELRIHMGASCETFFLLLHHVCMAPYTFLEDIRADPPFPAAGMVSRTMFDDDHVKLVAFSFAAGHKMAAHTAPVAIMLHFLEGDAELTLGDLAKAVRPGSMVHLLSWTSSRNSGEDSGCDAALYVEAVSRFEMIVLLWP